MSEERWVLLIASEVGGTDSVSDRAMERLCEAIHEEGYRVVRTRRPRMDWRSSSPTLRSVPSCSTGILRNCAHHARKLNRPQSGSTKPDRQSTH
jgi:hypothetical protein